MEEGRDGQLEGGSGSLEQKVVIELNCTVIGLCASTCGYVRVQYVCVCVCFVKALSSS